MTADSANDGECVAKTDDEGLALHDVADGNDCLMICSRRIRNSVRKVRRPRGRPPVRSDEETRHLLIESGEQEFGAKGFAGACMADVAERAGVSTKTIYRLFPNKSDLLAHVVSDRIGQFMVEIDADALDALPISDALERIMTAFGTVVLSERVIAMHRLVIGEWRNFLRLPQPSMNAQCSAPMTESQPGCVAC